LQRGLDRPSTDLPVGQNQPVCGTASGREVN
jgi:hypothetical protein